MGRVGECEVVSSVRGGGTGGGSGAESDELDRDSADELCAFKLLSLRSLAL